VGIGMRVLRAVYLVLLALFFFVPLIAMGRFAFQSVPVVLLTPERLLEGWSISGLIDVLGNPGFQRAAFTSLQLAALAIAITLILLLPLAALVEIKAPRLRTLMTAVTLLPWVVPPVALVVGVAATFRNTVPWFLASPYSLVPFYVLWALPFSYRALDAGLRSISARTLYEAARVMGASTFTIIFRVIVPNMVGAIIAASVLTAALVLGEFAFASLLLKETLPTFMAVFQRSEPRAGMALALSVLLLTALIIWMGVRALRKRGMDLQAAGV
jgi:putative spermidine/putrescine transport system permease protein